MLIRKKDENDPNWTPDDEQGLKWAERQSAKDKARSLPNYEALLTHQAFSREGERDNTYPSAVGDYARESIPNFPIGTKETRPIHPYNIGYDPKTLPEEVAFREARRKNLQNSLLKLMKGIPLQKISLPDESTRGGREAIERIERIAQKVRPDHYGASGRSKSPLDVARPYLNLVRNGAKAGHIDHVVGHNALAEVHNIMNYGEDYEDHPDAIRYDTRKRNKNPEWAYLGKPEHDDPGNLSLNAFHKDYVNDAIHSSVSNKGRGLMDDLHRRIRMESPQWNPDDVSFTHAQVPAAMTDTQSGGFSESVAMPEDESIKPGQNLGYVDRPWWPETHHRDPENMPWGKTEGYPPRSEQNLGYPSFESRRQEYDEDESPAMGGGTIQPKPQQPKPQPNAFERLYRQHFDEGNITKLMKFIKMNQKDEEPENIPPELSLRGSGSHPLPGSAPGDYERGWGPPEETYKYMPLAATQNEEDFDEQSGAMTADQFRETSDYVPPHITRFRRLPGRYEFGGNELSRPHIQNAIENSLLKEGDGGGDGGFNGLNGTVFTSAHAGIFTPSFGEQGTQRRHRKNKRRNDHKRKKLMGEDKKNGVDRLVQFLQEGSPTLRKRQPNKDMTGQFQSIHVDRRTPRKQIDWQKERIDKGLEKISEEIDWKQRQKGISEVGDHPTMGLNNAADGKMVEAATLSTYPHADDAKEVGTKSIPKVADWGTNKQTVQKADIPLFDEQAVPSSLETFPDPLETHKLEQQPNLENTIEKASSGDTIGIGPLTRQNTRAANGRHPQDPFTDTTTEEEQRQQAGLTVGMESAVLEQDDVGENIKGYDNDARIIKSGWGSGIDIHQDDLRRGGDLDTEDVDIEDDEKEDSKDWVSEEEERTKTEKEWLAKFQLMHKNFVGENSATPILAALLAIDNE